MDGLGLEECGSGGVEWGVNGGDGSVRGRAWQRSWAEGGRVFGMLACSQRGGEKVGKLGGDGLQVVG